MCVNFFSRSISDILWHFIDNILYFCFTQFYADPKSFFILLQICPALLSLFRQHHFPNPFSNTFLPTSVTHLTSSLQVLHLSRFLYLLVSFLLFFHQPWHLPLCFPLHFITFSVLRLYSDLTPDISRLPLSSIFIPDFLFSQACIVLSLHRSTHLHTNRIYNGAFMTRSNFSGAIFTPSDKMEKKHMHGGLHKS